MISRNKSISRKTKRKKKLNKLSRNKSKISKRRTKKNKNKNLQKGGMSNHTLVWKLNTDEDISKWNDILKKIGASSTTREVRESWGYGELGISTAGIVFARVNKERVNPHVAVIVDNDINSLDELEQMGVSDGDHDLARGIYGFVPFSVIDTNSPYKLILPMGLQKNTYRIWCYK
jgi:hypothetical protein